MPKTDIKNLLEDSKKELEQDFKNFERAIEADLDSFKKKTLAKI